MKTPYPPDEDELLALLREALWSAVTAGFYGLSRRDLRACSGSGR